jgi:hypothetical protein
MRYKSFENKNKNKNCTLKEILTHVKEIRRKRKD